MLSAGVFLTKITLFPVNVTHSIRAWWRARLLRHPYDISPTQYRKKRLISGNPSKEGWDIKKLEFLGMKQSIPYFEDRVLQCWSWGKISTSNNSGEAVS